MAIKFSHQIVLLLVGLDGPGVSTKGIGSLSRIDKLLFLAGKEAGLQNIDGEFRSESCSGPEDRDAGRAG